MRKVAFTVLKVIIVATSIAYLYLRLSSEDLENMASSSFASDGPIHLFYLSIIMLFISAGSWWFEAAKWKLLYQKETSLSTLQSLKVVLIALAGGILTPGKIGEYGLRAAAMPKSFRKEAPGKQWLNNFSLTYAGWVIGAVGTFLYAYQSPDVGPLHLSVLVIIGLAGLPVVHIVFYKGAAWIGKKLPSSWSSFWHDLPSGAELDRSRSRSLIGLSALRYLLFSFGNTLIWWGIGLHPNFLIPFIIIQAAFFTSIFLPVVSLFGVVVRGGIAVALATPFQIAPEGVLLAIFFNWIFQTALPLSVGLVLLLLHPFDKKQ